ncbi:MAG: DUF2945 domain-containing protein [Bdellovibrionota bacterium]|nr:DUF2945 domain-containing protein [Bdellovibrionota bacterium]
MIREGSKVKWQWGDGTASGEVVKIYKSDIEKTIDGSSVKREASQNSPAYLIKQEDGQEVLKTKSEVSHC